MLTRVSRRVLRSAARLSSARGTTRLALSSTSQGKRQQDPWGSGERTYAGERPSFKDFSSLLMVAASAAAVTASTSMSNLDELSFEDVLSKSYENGVSCADAAGASENNNANEGSGRGLNVDYDTDAHLMNWSRTHEARPAKLFEPDSVEQLIDIVVYAQANGRKIRPVGTFLSPNGIASSPDIMVSLAGVDRIINIDLEKQEVTVEAGIVVDTLLKELAKHGLTLANFSSIKEQQMGGWTQVAAHGTGATLPTVDEMITRMKIVTPGEGVIELSAEDEGERGELFRMARVGLGALGIVTELTLSCVPTHKLHEHSYVVHGLETVRRDHKRLLNQYRHVRYMWIPGTDACVVVVSNPCASEEGKAEGSGVGAEEGAGTLPLRNLLSEVRSEAYMSSVGKTLSFSQLREQLLDVDPLDAQWVVRVNEAEMKYWEAVGGERIGWSDEILGFDCGGSQWVFEVCLPAGSLESPDGAGLDFIDDLKLELAAAGLPAPAPIEQRWTASSTSPMSPAYSDDPSQIFSWVGGIMYMPESQDAAARDEITKKFRKYMDIMRRLGDRYKAHAHWGKIELPDSDAADYRLRLVRMQRHLRERYPVEAFNRARKKLDPKSIMSNKLISTLFDQ